MIHPDDFITVCPACGFSYKTFDPVSRQKIKKCPMCGYEIIEPDLFPDRQRDIKDKNI
jgi:predicted Zn-ribbon and HTH transcriptional regulator